MTTLTAPGPGEARPKRSFAVHKTWASEDLQRSRRWETEMKKNLLIPLLVTLLVVAAASPSSGPRADTTAVLNLVALGLAMLDAIPEPLVDPLDPPGFFQVKPQEFEPGKTNLVQAAWLNGTGCPTNATIALPNASFTGVGSFTTYTDPAC